MTSVLKEIEAEKHDVIILNFANPDMVGHTGVMDAAVKAVEVIDDCMSRIVEKIKKKNGIVLITADHGNVEQMSAVETDQPHTAHTVNSVPFIYVDNANPDARLQAGRLEDVAPTLLRLLGIEKPAEMTGKPLIS